MQRQPQQLPEELIIEILLRLPVKYLVRLKCVCKSWLSLISDSHFATSHFNLVITAAPTHNQKLILIPACPSQTRSIDFEASLNDDTATASVNFHFLNLKIGGSCRGFIFFHSHWDDLYIWNPSTGIHKQIPASPIVYGVYNKPFFTHLYGFGYDPSTDDYLVVIGSRGVTLTATDVSTHFEFFSLRANTWKVVKVVKSADLSYLIANDNPGVGTVFNGTIHWLITCVDTFVKVIFAFDLTERRISEIPLPDIFYSSNLLPSNSDLWVFGGLLSLWAMNSSDTIEIWVMKEYNSVGVHSSWTKTFVLSMDDDYIRYFYPICSTSSGDIVGSNRSTGLVKKYNANGQLIEHRSYCNQHRSQVDFYNYPYQSQVALYTQSLLQLPLPGDTRHA